MTSPARRFLLRVAGSLTLLAVLAVLVDTGEVLERLSAMRLPWVVAGLALSVGQIMISAWRWKYTAGRLGIRLTFRDAVAEYYLATFLNQVLPGGVLGDISRAWRHARRAVPESSADDRQEAGLRSVHAVILERTSGQAVMTGVALLSVVVLLLPRTGAVEALLPDHPLARFPGVVSIPAVVSALVFLGWLTAAALRRLMRFPALDRFLTHARRALLGAALPVQLGLSLLVVGSYVAVFVVAARGMGMTIPLTALLPLVPPLLVTMLVPVSVAGWGVREGAAALLWSAVGLTAGEGVSLSVAYGLLVLVSSLPGAAVVLLALRSPPEIQVEEDVSAQTEVAGRRT